MFIFIYILYSQSRPPPPSSEQLALRLPRRAVGKYCNRERSDHSEGAHRDPRSPPLVTIVIMMELRTCRDHSNTNEDRRQHSSEDKGLHLDPNCKCNASYYERCCKTRAAPQRLPCIPCMIDA